MVIINLAPKGVYDHHWLVADDLSQNFLFFSVDKMSAESKKRERKLEPGELCAVCKKRPAKGIKYNAVSCDACRVFFRRVVKDTDDSIDYR